MSVHPHFQRIQNLKTANWANNFAANFTQKNLAASQKIFFLSLLESDNKPISVGLDLTGTGIGAEFGNILCLTRGECKKRYFSRKSYIKHLVL